MQERFRSTCSASFLSLVFPLRATWICPGLNLFYSPDGLRRIIFLEGSNRTRTRRHPMIFVFRKRRIHRKKRVSSDCKVCVFRMRERQGDNIHCHRCRRSWQLTRRYPRDSLSARYRQRFCIDTKDGKRFTRPLSLSLSLRSWNSLKIYQSIPAGRLHVLSVHSFRHWISHRGCTHSLSLVSIEKIKSVKCMK
jgi:hypothetical protein